jgi:hypothetical protein
MTTPSFEGEGRTITGCAPSSTCPFCQAGRRRFRDTYRKGKVKTVEYKHVGELPDHTTGKMRGALILCHDQTFGLDLTGKF